MLTYSELPTAWIASWSEDGTNVTFPIASVPELSAAEADAATGDFRRVWYAICKQIADEYEELPVVERPAKMRVFSSASIDPNTNTVSRSFTMQFDTDVLTEEVQDEPVV